MAHSPTIRSVRDAQRAEAYGLTPAERLIMALELSDFCAQLNAAGAKALEGRHAAGVSETVRRTS